PATCENSSKSIRSMSACTTVSPVSSLSSRVTVSAREWSPSSGQPPRSSHSSRLLRQSSTAPSAITTTFAEARAPVVTGVSVVIREVLPLGRALLQERVPALDRLVGHVGQARGLVGEDLLAHQAVVGEVDGELEHPLRGGRLAVALPRPLDRRGLELGVVHHPVDRAHVEHLLGGVRLPQEEDLARELLA